MNLSMEEIGRGLKDYAPILLLRDGVPDKINSIRFADTREGEVREDVLFIVQTSKIKAIKFPKCRNIMLIGADCLPTAWQTRNVNFILIPGSQQIETIFNAVQELLTVSLDLANHAITLLNSIVQGRGLKDIVEMVARTYERPVLLLDSGFKILAHSSTEAMDEPVLAKWFALGYLPWDIVNELKERGIIARAVENRQPIIMHSWLHHEMERILCTVEADDKLLAYFAVLANGRAFTKPDMELAALMSKIIAAEMRKSAYKGNTQSLIHENLLLDLLENNITREEVALERARSADLHLGPWLSTLTIDVHKHQANPYMTDYLRESFESWFPRSKAIQYKKYVLVLLDLRDKMGIDEVMDNRLEDFMVKHDLTGGVSRCFNRLIALPEHHEQAMMALEMAKIMGATGSLFYYEDYKFYHLLSLLGESIDTLKFCHPAVFRLINYDQRHNSNYLGSLWIYLECRQNLLAAAERLLIHRNTMNYRLSRITEIGGLDLTDDETIFQLLLSQRIVRFNEQVAEVL